MTDTDQPSPTQSDSDRQLYRLTLSEVMDMFAAAGLPRSYRTIQRYCETGRLDAMKTDSGTGEQYFVKEASVPRAIEELKQLFALTDRPSQTAVDLGQPSHVQQAPEPPPAPDVFRQSPTEPDVSKHDGVGDLRYVEQLETRIEEKDDVIGLLRDQLKTKDMQLASASERDRETNILIQGLQNMVLTLQAPNATRTPPRDVPVEERGSQDAGI